MKSRYVVFCCLSLVLSGCNYQNFENSLYTKKSKTEKEIDKFHLKMEDAQKVVSHADENLKKLKQELTCEQLAWIELRVESFEHFLTKLSQNHETYAEFLQKKEITSLFLEERELLNSLLKTAPYNEKEVRDLHDRILRLITKLNDQKQKEIGKLP